MSDELQDGEKTEDATPRRREEAREQGRVAISSELLTAAVLCAGLAALVLGGGRLASSTGALIEKSVTSLPVVGREELSPSRCTGLFAASLESMVLPLACLVLPILCGVLLVGYSQVGFRITSKAIAWDLGRVNPLKGLRRVFSGRALVRTAISLVKIVVIAGAIAAVVWGDFANIGRLSGSELGPMLAGLGHVTLRAGGAGLVAVASIALCDFTYQRWQHEHELKMTKREIKDEVKRAEGDPHVKARVRHIQRELARRRMMAEVPKATVVITNPTHYAVALRYERDGSPGRDESGRGAPARGEKGSRRRAPYVVAKGADLVAERIKSVAHESNVACYEDVALARALHAGVEIGQEIPEDFYQAVASVLAYVYRLRRSPLTAAQ